MGLPSLSRTLKGHIRLHRSIRKTTTHEIFDIKDDIMRIHDDVTFEFLINETLHVNEDDVGWNCSVPLIVRNDKRDHDANQRHDCNSYQDRCRWRDD